MERRFEQSLKRFKRGHVDMEVKCPKDSKGVAYPDYGLAFSLHPLHSFLWRTMRLTPAKAPALEGKLLGLCLLCPWRR